MNKKAQVIKCKCGSIFAACYAPECYEDSDWIKDLKKYVNAGFEVDLLTIGSFQLNKCLCGEVKTEPENKAQLNMFS